MKQYLPDPKTREILHHHLLESSMFCLEETRTVSTRRITRLLCLDIELFMYGNPAKENIICLACISAHER